MELEKLKNDLESSYNKEFRNIDERVGSSIDYIKDDLKLSIDEMNLQEIKTIVTTILNIETLSLRDDVESLLKQKEIIDRSLQVKSQALQTSKCDIFNAIEARLEENETTLSKLHQVKLQSIELYDFLNELVESAIITALERDDDGDIEETIEEVTKDITYEAIKEGSLNTIRIKKIISIILQSAIDIAEATPTKANEILGATLRGIRGGLVHSIARFKKRLEFIPMEAKHILIEDYDTLMEDLNQTDTLFSQVITTKADENTQQTKELLLEINNNMRYDLQELVSISKETADVMKKRFSLFAKTAVKKADTAMKSQTAKEAKRMGKQALGVARVALGSAIKSAKEAIDSKK